MPPKKGSGKKGSKKKGKKGKKKKIVEEPELVHSLMKAAASNDLESLQSILSMPIGERRWDFAQTAGETIIKACEKGHVEAARLVMQAGCNVNIQGGKSLHLACQNGHLPVVQLLIESDADINSKAVFIEWTPLHFAAHAGHVEICHYLLSLGAQVDAKTHEENCGTTNGWSALHLAADAGHLGVVQFLVEHAKATIDLPSALNDTALAIAAEHGKWEVVQYLVTAGANIHSSRRGMNVVQWACYRCTPEIVQFLVSYGAKPDLSVKVLWFPPDQTLQEVIKEDFSKALYEKVDASIYRGSCLLRERAAHMRALSEVRWEEAPVYDPYSFDPLPPPETRALPKHIIHIISTYDI